MWFGVSFVSGIKIYLVLLVELKLLIIFRFVSGIKIFSFVSGIEMDLVLLVVELVEFNKIIIVRDLYDMMYMLILFRCILMSCVGFGILLKIKYGQVVLELFWMDDREWWKY